MNENKGHGFPDVIQQAIDAFAAALGKDFDECMKQVGVLELCRFPDVEFFVGLAFHGNKDFTKAIEHFIRVAPSSRFYPDALVYLAYDYSCIQRFLSVPLAAVQNIPSFAG